MGNMTSQKEGGTWTLKYVSKLIQLEIGHFIKYDALRVNRD